MSGKFVPVTPTRLLDTRNGTGTGGAIAPVGPNASVLLNVSNVTGNSSVVPTAVVLNVTAADATASGYSLR